MQVDPIISAKNVEKSYAKAKVLHGISLDVEEGEILAVMGPSGSGKSTLLHCLAAIIPIDAGQVSFEGANVSGLKDEKRSILRRTRFGFVFQFSQLVPELSLVDNVALPLLLNGVRRKESYATARDWLALVGLGKKESSSPGEISGGEAQRAAIARAMVNSPSVIFADEPTGSLDSFNSEHVMEMFVSAAKNLKTTVILVTHEPSISAFADREIVVRDGKLVGAA